MNSNPKSKTSLFGLSLRTKSERSRRGQNSKWYYLIGFAVVAVALWLMPQALPLRSVFAGRALHDAETNARFGSYHWTAPQGELTLPRAWWSERVVLRQKLSAGPVARPLTLQSTGTPLSFMLQPDLPRVYAVLLPASAQALHVAYSIPPLAPTAREPRELGMIVVSAELRELGGLRVPAPPLLALLALLPLTERAAAAWGMGRTRWLLAAALVGAALLHMRADSVQALASGPALALGLGLAGVFGWLLRRLVPGVLSLPTAGTATELAGPLLLWSVAASLAPLLFVVAGLGDNLLPAWPILLVPPLAALLVVALPQARRFLPILAALAGGTVLVWGGLNFYPDAIQRSPSDFRAYYDAAVRRQQGAPLYDVALLAANPFATTYKYHPAFLLLIAPLATLPFAAAATAWRVLNVAALLASAALVIATRPRAQRLELAALTLFLLLSFSPISRSLRFGQAEPLVLLLITAATLLYAGKRRGPAALLWAFAGLVKVYPLVLLLPVALRERGRTLILYISMTLFAGLGWVLTSALLFGWRNELLFWREVTPLLGARDGRLSNLSIYGVVARLIEPASFDGAVAVPAALLPALLLSAAVVLLLLLALWRGRAVLAAQPWAALSLMLCTVLLLLPVSWDHYHALLLLPLLLSWSALREGRGAAALWLAAFTLLIFGVARDVWPRDALAPSAFVLLFGSYRFFGLLLLWLWWLRYFWTGDGGRRTMVIDSSPPV